MLKCILLANEFAAGITIRKPPPRRGTTTGITEFKNAMRKVLPPSIFIFFIVFLLISGLAGISVLSLQINQKNKNSQLYSPATGPVTSEPTVLTLRLQSPEDNLLTFQSSIIVSGQALPNTVVLISSDKKNKIITPELDGSFSTVMQLDEGVNKLTTVVFNRSGDQKSIEKIIYYSKEKI